MLDHQCQTDDLNPDMLRLARESRGLTQKELCEVMGIHQGTVSKIENRLLAFTQEFAERAATALDYPISFFCRKSHLSALSVTYYRRNLNLPVKQLQQVEAKLDIACLSIDRLLNSVDLPQPDLVSWSVPELGEPERAAKALRERWRLPRGPIRDLIQLLEDKGILVVTFDFAVEGVEGFAVRGADNRPIIFVNQNLPSDRRRLTIAHELGHLIMHIGQPVAESRDVEREAFGFATEFLVPEAEFMRGSRKLDLATLATMKQYWFVSMSSLIVKADRLNLITKNQNRYLWAQMSKNNYMKREPVTLDLPLEEPSLLKEVIEVHKNDLDYSIDELAQLVSLKPKEFLQYFFGQRRGLFQLFRNEEGPVPGSDAERSSFIRRV